jgi:alkanesulfonate monooxygenase SsuD/methylene tetrahydromethanopterin reductase-like flavin-dependent oxidoreductase (luciferase family)
LAPLADVYRLAGTHAGHPPSALRLSIGTHLHVAEDSQTARDEFYPHYSGYFRNHTPSQYKARDITRADYDALAAPHGALFVGSPSEIVDKILYEHGLFGHQRFLAQIDIGGLPFASVASVIELMAAKVVPAVRRAI